MSLMDLKNYSFLHFLHCTSVNKYSHYNFNFRKQVAISTQD